MLIWKMHLRASDDWSISAWLERHVNPECLLFSRIIIEIVQIAYIFMYITDTRSKLFSCGGFWSKAASKITYLLAKLDEKKNKKKHHLSFMNDWWISSLVLSNISAPIYFYWAILRKSAWHTAKRSFLG